MREKFSCRSCEKITQPPAPFRVIARARAGASLLAMILYAKFGEHQPLNRQSESYGSEGIELDVSTLADWVGAWTASLAPLIELIRSLQDPMGSFMPVRPPQPNVGPSPNHTRRQFLRPWLRTVRRS